LSRNAAKSGRQVADALVALIDALTLLLDAGSIELAALHQGIGLVVHVLDAVFVRHDIRLDQLMLLHEVLDRGQILTRILSGQKTLDLAQPEVQILDSSDIGALLIRLL